MTINNLEIPLNATIRQEYVKCGNPHVVHISTVFATANDLRQCSTQLGHRPEIQHSLIQRMSSGQKLSTEEELILLDQIAKNTRLGIDGKLHDDVTRSTVTVMKSGFFIIII